MTKPVHRRALTLIHILGAMVCMAIVGTATASAPTNCSMGYYMQCPYPCNRVQLRNNFACCNQIGSACCQRECTLSTCSGPPGSWCSGGSFNEYLGGTLKQGQNCVNNFCDEP